MNPVWEIVPYTRGKGIEVHSESRIFAHFMRADPECIKAQSLDFVFTRGAKAIDPQWWRILKYGGHLVTIGPDVSTDLDHYDEVRREDTDEGIFQVYRRKQSGGRLVAHDVIPAKSVAVVRYGAYGDAIQASSILPWLKAQGYHITFYGHETSYDVLKHDPHIDRWVVQDRDQVPNEALLQFWLYEAKKYERWINLSESVEGTLLATEDRAPFYWPKEARHKHMNRNYLEMVHEIADVPLPPRAKFHATPDEMAWAKKQKEKAGTAIVYSLSGSSIHKAWPHLDALIARIMLDSPSAKVVLVGADSDAWLQEPWAKEDRVWKMAGKWSIRQAMAFAEESDLVIGSETGLLNAVGLADVHKIVFLSHSSEENLTKHWKKTTALVPRETVGCYPCHKLVMRWDHCHKDEETGVALCQAKIDIDTAWLAVQDVFKEKRGVRLLHAA